MSTNNNLLDKNNLLNNNNVLKQKLTDHILLTNNASLNTTAPHEHTKLISTQTRTKRTHTHTHKPAKQQPLTKQRKLTNTTHAY